MSESDLYEKIMESFNKINWEAVMITIAAAEIINYIKESTAWERAVQNMEKY